MKIVYENRFSGKTYFYTIASRLAVTYNGEGLFEWLPWGRQSNITVATFDVGGKFESHFVGFLPRGELGWKCARGTPGLGMKIMKICVSKHKLINLPHLNTLETALLRYCYQQGKAIETFFRLFMCEKIGVSA